MVEENTANQKAKIVVELKIVILAVCACLFVYDIYMYWIVKCVSGGCRECDNDSDPSFFSIIIVAVLTAIAFVDANTIACVAATGAAGYSLCGFFKFHANENAVRIAV